MMRIQSHTLLMPLGLALALSAATPSLAATIHVTTTADGSIPGECTLRDAVLASNTDAAVQSCPAGTAFDVIQLQQNATYVLSAAGGGDLDIGPGGPPVRGKLKIQGHGSTIEQSAVDRVLDIAHTSVDLHDLTITGGIGFTSGGGIRLDNGRLSGHNVRVVDNEAVFGGGIYAAGVIDLDLDNWAISDNRASFAPQPIAFGGGLYLNLASAAPSSVRLRHCRVERNVADASSGALAWVSRNSGADRFEMKHSVVADNTAGTSVGGMWFLANFAATATNFDVDISHTTIANNQAGDIGGSLVVLVFPNNGSARASIRHSTIENNSSLLGAGVLVQGEHVSLSIAHSTVSGNQAVNNGGNPATGIGGGVLSVAANTTLNKVRLHGNTAAGNPMLLQGIGGAVVNGHDGTGGSGAAATMSLVDCDIAGNDAPLADGVATLNVAGPAFPVMTTFRMTSICEEDDTCVSDYLFPTTEISLGNNRESDNKCGFTQPSDQVNASCASPLTAAGELTPSELRSGRVRTPAPLSIDLSGVRLGLDRGTGLHGGIAPDFTSSLDRQ